MKPKTIQFALIILMLLVPLFSHASGDFDQQRPEYISDKKWSSLKAAVQEAKLLPTPAGIGGANSQFGTSVSVDGNRALIGAPFIIEHGVVYVMDFVAGNWVETQILMPSDGASGDNFGYAVSLSGDRALVGAYRDDDNGTDSGSAYIFDVSGGSWSQTAKLSASDGAASDNFGVSVSLSADRALVGAYLDDDNGSAYIFKVSGGSWSQTTKLIAGDGAANDLFGVSVSLSGDRALVGAYTDDDNGSDSGSAYIFDLSGGSWSQTAKLNAGDGAANDYFGYSVSLSGDRALIGAYGNDDNGSYSGSAYIFEVSAGSWSQTAKLSAGDGAAYDNFGISVSLSGDRVLVGAILDDDQGSDSGSAYIFEVSGGSWSQIAKLSASDGTGGDRFGNSVSLSDNRVLVGAFFDDDQGTESGSAYIFEVSGGSWSQTAKLIAGDGAAYDQFGISVSLSGDRALVGANLDDDNGSNSGSAYIFEVSGGSWSQTAKLSAGDGAANDYFGYSVSLSGDRALVGAYRDDDNGTDSGSAYIFEVGGGNWSQTAKLNAGDGAANDFFGFSVNLSGDRALIGAYFDDDNGANNSGSAYVFDLSGGTWSQTAKLTAGVDAGAGDLFGVSVSLSADRALIGANGDDDHGSGSGSAYIFDLSGGSWSQTAKLSASDGTANEEFGRSVSLSGDRALIGAYRDADNGIASGSAYIFEVSGGSWSQIAKLSAGDGAAGDFFGVSVSLSSYRALVGAYFDDDNGTSSGSAYIINLNPKFSVGGNITGLATGNTVELENNTMDTQSFANGMFTFATELADGASYDVKVSNPPSIPNQTCTITGGSNGDGTGIVNSADVVINVNCVTNQYQVGVTVSGLGSGSVVLQNNGTDDLTVSANGVLTNFATAMDDGSDYAITVLTHPIAPEQTCFVSGGNSGDNNGTGTLSGDNDSSVVITCNTAPSVINDSYSINEDGSLTADDADGSVNNVEDDGILANDTDVESNTITVVNPGTYNGSIGDLLISADGTFTYTATADLNGLEVFHLMVTDTFNTVATTLTINVQAVNDQPSFAIIGDLVVSNLVTPSNTTAQINNFAESIVLGPTDEQNSQAVNQFIVNITSDSNNIIDNNMLTVANDGTLNAVMTLNSGTAMVEVSMQDDGGTDFAGVDTSAVQQFTISYSNFVFDDGFESTTLKVIDYLKSIQKNSIYREYPRYDYKTDSVIFYGHLLPLNYDYDSEKSMQKLKLWLQEILMKNDPHGDFDNDGVVNSMDDSPFK